MNPAEYMQETTPSHAILECGYNNRSVHTFRAHSPIQEIHHKGTKVVEVHEFIEGSAAHSNKYTELAHS